ncbi:MAG TPA: hypothetical protein VE972_15300, partial [Conexibacter sp.]|nr:hypothetical protein [Conexibacter sp.]
GISHSTKQGALKAQRARAGIRRMLELAHVVTTTSPALAEQYCAWGAARVRVVDNFLPARYAVSTSPPREDHTVTIGWTVGAEHRHDLLALGMRETLKDLLAAYAHVRVVSIGLDLGLSCAGYRRQGLVQYGELADHVAGFDIGIAPLDDIPFNRARSSVKLKEYAAAGVSWLASPIGPYAALGERQGGRLVPDGAWYRELERLVLDARARGKLAKRGRKWAAGQTVAANLAVWEDVLAEAVEVARGS